MRFKTDGNTETTSWNIVHIIVENRIILKNKDFYVTYLQYLLFKKMFFLNLHNTNFILFNCFLLILVTAQEKHLHINLTTFDLNVMHQQLSGKNKDELKVRVYIEKKKNTFLGDCQRESFSN